MSESEHSNSATPKKTVLLIDDSKSARRVTSAHLTAAGFSVITASDGFAALADVVEHQPHIIVADIVMPRLDGYQTCALLKRNPDYQAIPVVLVSSRDGLFDRARGRLVGADAHVAKPFTEAELVSTINQCLDASSANVSPDTKTHEPVKASQNANDIANESEVVSPV